MKCFVLTEEGMAELNDAVKGIEQSADRSITEPDKVDQYMREVRSGLFMLKQLIRSNVTVVTEPGRVSE